LTQLEAELGALQAGLPADPELTELVGRILHEDYPDADLQIVVSTARKTTTTKQCYETETPGMVGLGADQLHDLQRKLMTKISSPDDTVFGTTASGMAATDATAPPPDAIQKKEVREEAEASNDGKEAVAKKMTRVVTTSQSAVTGAQGREAHGDAFIRLKVNQQVYDGRRDGKERIRLIPIQRIQPTAFTTAAVPSAFI
jgi:hypothetical protein